MRFGADLKGGLGGASGDLKFSCFGGGILKWEGSAESELGTSIILIDG